MSVWTRSTIPTGGQDSYPTASSVRADVNRLFRTLLRPRTLAAVVAASVLVGSLLPPAAIPSAPPQGQPSAPTVFEIFGLGVGVDKPIHALSYALLGGLAAAWRGRQSGLALVGVVVAVAAFGAGVEVAQLAVPGRTASVGDGVANLVGAVAGVTSWWLWDRPRWPARRSTN